MIDIKELPTDNELNSRLRVENSLSRSDGMVYGAIWMRDTYAKPLLEENAKLREQLQIAKEALEIYGNENSWFRDAYMSTQQLIWFRKEYPTQISKQALKQLLSSEGEK